MVKQRESGLPQSDWTIRPNGWVEPPRGWRRRRNLWGQYDSKGFVTVATAVTRQDEANGGAIDLSEGQNARKLSGL